MFNFDVATKKENAQEAKLPGRGDLPFGQGDLVFGQGWSSKQFGTAGLHQVYLDLDMLKDALSEAGSQKLWQNHSHCSISVTDHDRSI